MKRFLSYYHPKLPVHLTYMLQQVEYNPHKFMGWLFKFPDLTRVMKRQKTVWTSKAKILAGLIYVIFIFYALAGIGYSIGQFPSGLTVLLLVPVFVILFTYLLVLAAWQYVEEPRRRKLLNEASKVFEQHPGVKVAILGSYGKTTMKELLATVIGQGKKVAFTPGNKNVPVSHAAWSRHLKGDEEVLLIEYGEGAPGDIKKLSKLSKPDMAVITGLAPNHLDQYKHLDAVVKDLLSVTDYVKDPDMVYVNGESKEFEKYLNNSVRTYTAKKVDGWAISNESVSINGVSFTMKKNSVTFHLKSGLLGRHQIGPLAFAAALAHKLGLSKHAIESGVAMTIPYEHRMQPRQQHGAWIIDDTYNGSLEGLRAGLGLLGELPAERKIYVTPGLVDQGEETERVHYELGKLIAESNPDRTVLMQNSTTEHIVKGLEDGDYKGELDIQADPLAFYMNLEHIVAAGDLVLLQNDWTDNYS